MNEHTKFAFGFDRLEDWSEDGKVHWRFWSRKIYGPVCPTRGEAFVEWVKNWWLEYRR